MKITACSIVKNEAHNIARSIESFKGAVDEIIIVDTGSTDNTVEICKSYGATTLFYEWSNDFSAAKNYALEHAKGDWILFLDADEWFVPKLSRKTITNLLRQIDKIADGLMTTMCEFNDITNKIFARELTTRIFRNSKNIRFKGSIHERLSDNDNEIKQAHCPDIEIFHSGYAAGMVEKKAKRNIDILNTIYSKGEVHTPLYYYLFRENYILGNIDEAIKFYDIFMEQIDVDKVIKNDDSIVCVYELMYRIMVHNQERFNQSDINILLNEAYSKYSMLPMHSYLLGCEKMKSDYSEGFNWISKALNLNRGYLEPFTNSFVAFVNDAYFKLGYISQEQGNLDQALTYYMEAIKTASTQELVTILLSVIKIVVDQPKEEIILFLNSLLDTKKKESVEAVLGALKQTRLHKVFVYYAIKYNQEFDGQDETTYLAMILTGKTELAIETAILAIRNEKEVGADGQIEGITRYDITGKSYKENWHLDYAVIAVLYSKRIDLFKKYREHFRPVQMAIIKAYLRGETIPYMIDELKFEFEKIYNMVFYIFEESDMEQLKRIIIG